MTEHKCPNCENLRRQVEEHNDFLAFMREELQRLPCCHEEGLHHDTPPMMWPELIRCIAVRYHRDQMKKATQ